ncbi:imidazolonepropionase [Alteromonas sp. ASW11-36]|uniref:Imidazolonepropionase n=1 Tax=Alteromonas arenosi TaxID=3055817 RepID=A0ABT7SV26_9ALTE|nr:imidazolonepropionase [Alteromonas sp. ASW11-36]MDM7859394.1 imidazolonepropionase [Alteromonas sp. ASW11-36]
MTQHADTLLFNAQIATVQPDTKGYGLIDNGWLAVNAGKIVALGQGSVTDIKAQTSVDLRGQLLTPGLIDCHTHLVFGGDRANEFEQRLEGLSYEAIAKAGGGIKSTVKATREASFERLLQLAQLRLQRLINDGVTSVEIKSGYGLDIATERKILQVAEHLKSDYPVTIQRTYLGAHALPPEFANSSDDYIGFVCETAMPQLAGEGLIDAVDVFCEGIGFSPQQCEQVYQTAQSLGLPIKAHAEQLSDLGGAKLAAQYQALSVDHLEYLNTDDVASLKHSGTVAVLLPGAFYFLREQQLPPIDALRQHGVPMAIASDLNPGSSPINSLLTIMNMACVLFRLTPAEVLRGVTQHAAMALGLEHKGVIAVGKDADLCVWDVEHPAQIIAGMNQHSPQQVWIRGERVISK